MYMRKCRGAGLVAGWKPVNILSISPCDLLQEMTKFDFNLKSNLFQRGRKVVN